MQLIKPLWQKNIFILVLLAFFSFTMLASINGDLIPGSGSDFWQHAALLYHAKLALKQHQWPIRTMINDFGYGIAYFQFYGPLTGTLGGLLLKFFNHLSPWGALKILMWLSSFLAGVYFYRIVTWLVHSRKIALMAAIVYQSTPYFIINMTIRGDLTECFGQGLVPVALYYTLILFFEPPNWRRFSLMSLSWFGILTSSIIVYFYTSLFMGLFFLFYTFLDRNKLQKLYWLAGAYVLGVFLAAWYIVPIALFKKFLILIGGLPNPYHFHQFTHLNALLSLVPVSASRLSIALLPALGWPILLGSGVCMYALWWGHISSETKIQNFAIILICLLVITTFMTWSPINFWKHLPKIMYLEQFSYRMLTQTMWIGTICFAIAMSYLLREKIEILHLWVAVFLVCLSTHSWLPHFKTVNSVPANIFATILNGPDRGVFTFYSYTLKNLKTIPEALITLTDYRNAFNCQQVKNHTICHLTVFKEGYYQLPILYYPKMLNFKVNNIKTTYVSISAKVANQQLNLVGIHLVPGQYKIDSQFTGIVWANWLSILAWASILINLCFDCFKKLISIKNQIKNRESDSTAIGNIYPI